MFLDDQAVQEGHSSAYDDDSASDHTDEDILGDSEDQADIIECSSRR